MELLIYLIVLAFALVATNAYWYHEHKKGVQREVQQAATRYIQQNKAKLEQDIQLKTEKLKEKQAEVVIQITAKKRQLEQLSFEVACLDKSLAKQKEQAKNYEQTLRASAEEVAKAYEQSLLAIAETRINSQKEGMQKAAEQAHAQTMAALGAQAEEAAAHLSQLQAEIADYSAKQAAINEAILRQRAIEEQQDFFRICLTPETADDVLVLNTVRQNLKKPEIIDKIIYDNYIAKPTLEMLKRVVQNESFSGIYKITCIKTGEVYIGKSTDIKSRFQQHVKTAYNCGTIAHSLLHTKMRQHGIENFTFEVVERVPKDQLSNREKFYIDFYQSREVGLNERRG